MVRTGSLAAGVIMSLLKLTSGAVIRAKGSIAAMHVISAVLSKLSATPLTLRAHIDITIVNTGQCVFAE